MTQKNSFKIYFICLLAVLNIFVWYSVFREDRGGILTVSFLDVGQGDSIFIDVPNGNQVLLDGGPDKKVLRELGGVMPFYDRSIDLVALSHPHEDHITGLVEIPSRYSVLGFLSSGTRVNTPQYVVLKDEIKKYGIADIVAKRGMKINLGSGVCLEVLLPFKDVSNSTPHEGMMVLRLVYGKTAIVLTGDMEKDLEGNLVYFYGQKLKSDVLKVGHHGSKNSTSEAFLGNISPKYAVISVGKGNMYGHPKPETIKILSDFGVGTFRTDEDGRVTMLSDGENISIKK